MNTAHSLSVFAHHVQTLTLAENGDQFGLYWSDNVKVQVRIENDQAYLNGKWVGSRIGAVQEYAKLVAADCGLTD